MSQDVKIKQRRCDLYRDKIILAPMVRENSLPFRLLCLRHGADLVYSEELIDYRLSECKRLENRILGTVDFIDERGEIIFRTCEEEKQQLIVQLGSNNPDRALKAARLVSADVAGIDFNFGCPKSFSISGGMGAALLDKPETIEALITKLVENLDIPVSCKMRVLPDLDKTLSLVKLIESSGASAIAVHGRTKEQRPHDENRDDFLKAIVNLQISIPIIANGGSNNIRSYSEILKFRQRTGASSVMIARAAMKNPSIFRSNNLVDPIEDVIKEFLKISLRYDNYVAVTKYAIQTMMSSGHYGYEFVRRFHSACDFKSMFELFDLNECYEELKGCDKTNHYSSDESQDVSLQKWIEEQLASYNLENTKVIRDNVPYRPKLYGPESPKAQLMDHSTKLLKESPDSDMKPEFSVFEYKRHRYYCIIRYNKKIYLNETFTSSKRNAEQASSLLVCGELGFVDLAEYRSRTSGVSKNIR